MVGPGENRPAVLLVALAFDVPWRIILYDDRIMLRQSEDHAVPFIITKDRHSDNGKYIMVSS